MKLIQNNDESICLKKMVLRCRELVSLLGVGKSTVYDWMNPQSPRFDATFPRPIKLGKASVGWISEEVYAWLNARRDSSRSSQ